VNSTSVHDRETEDFIMALSEADLAAIRAVIEQDAAAVRRSDWDAAVRLFTADAVRFPPHQAPIRGRAAMLAWLKTFPTIQEFDITADEIVGGDDVAFVRGRYTLTAAAPPGSPPVTDRGNYMGLLRKQPDGSWLWTTDMIASEL
jgi:ketosteroid isomerase-like protein